MSFDSFNLDSRLSQAVKTSGFTEPTPIQSASIPLALNDKKDIIAKARTGSGKTLAYLLPIIQLLVEKEATGNKCLIIVPSRELADQVSKVLSDLTIFLSRQVHFVNISQQVSDNVRTSLLADRPQIVIGTPSAICQHLENGNIDPTTLEFLVFDEADLLTTYGYEEDLEKLDALLKGVAVQTWLMSATLGDDIKRLKESYCKNPVTLKLQDTDKGDQLKQYYVKCSEFDKFLLAYVIFKLNLLKGKTIIFVNTVDRCYRLKLFFEQFGIKSIALNAELPVASRLHIVEQFNRNVYNLLIATDDSHEEVKRKKSSDYGVSRGIDFKNVSCVVNFDLPPSSKSYTHRVGRTARANRSGFSLSFVVPKEEVGKHKVATVSTAERDEKVLARIIKAQESSGNDIQPYKFDMEQVENFRYRCEDAFRAVTKVAVREARVKDFKNEIIVSNKLQRHFEENPDDLNALRHDVPLHPTRISSELKNVPSYLLPSSVTATKPLYTEERRIQKFKRKRRPHKGKKGDPLKKFKR